MPGLQGSGYPISGWGTPGVVNVHEAATDPTANNDSVDTAGIGFAFEIGDKWFNTVSGVMWQCVDDTPTAADWKELVMSDSTPADNVVCRFDGATGSEIQGSGWLIDDVAALRTLVDGTGDIGTAADFRPANIYATTSVNIGNGGFTASSTAVLGTSGAQIRINDVNLDFTTDGGGDIGGAADNRPANIYSTTSLVTAGTTTINVNGVNHNGAILRGAQDLSTGLGSASGVDTSSDVPLVLLSRNAARDAASAVVAATVFDRNAAAITNADTVRIHSFGWTNNANTYTELLAVRADGDLMWGSDGGGNIGAAAAGRPDYIYAVTQVRSGGTLYAGANTGMTVGGQLTVQANQAWGTGLSLNTSGIRQTTGNVTLAFVNQGTTDAADAVVAATVYDRNAAAITNADTMRIHSFGWTNNADAYTELLAVRADGDLMWGSDGGGDIGAAAAGRPANIYCTTQLRSSGSVIATNNIESTSGYAYARGAGMVGQLDLATGLGTTENFFTGSDYPLAIINRNRTDGADNVCIASVYDRGAAAITNASTMRLHSFGWTDNTNTYNELAYFTCDGALVFTDTNTATVTSDITDGAGAIAHKLDTSNALSTAGVKLLSIQNQGVEKLYIDIDGDLVTDTEVNAAQYIWAGTAGNGIYLDGDTGGTGLTGRELYTENVNHTLQIRSTKADGSGNLSIALDADVNAATINDDHKIASFGWINNSDTRTEVLYVTADPNLMWSTDGGGDIGASGANRPNNIYAAAAVNAATLVTAYAAGGRMNRIAAALGGGDGTYCYTFECNSTGNTASLYGIRSDGAGQVSTSIVADVDNATINATHIVCRMGWTNNADTFAELAKLTGDGGFHAKELRASSDIGGLASHTSLTNATGGAGSNPASMINLPGSSDGTQDGWIKMYVGTTAVWVPYWNN
jgi:hypothetical protein